MSPIRRLSDTERQALREASRNSCDAGLARRALGVLLFADGKEYSEICRWLSITKEALRKWLRRYECGGVVALATQPKPGRPSRVAPQIKPILADLVHRSPQTVGYAETTWTLRLLQQYLAEVHGIPAGRETVRSALGDLGWRWNRAKHTITSPDPEYERKKGQWTPSLPIRRPTPWSSLPTKPT